MSWDASFGSRDWNYTHNINGMVREAWQLTSGERLEDSWWRHLHGMTGKQGAKFLGEIIRGLQADPARFRAMNPENGWGSYDGDGGGIVRVLCEMRDASHNACCDNEDCAANRWHVSG